MWLTKGYKKIMFDIKITTPKGVEYCMYFKCLNEVGAVGSDKQMVMSIKEAHERLAHGHE